MVTYVFSDANRRTVYIPETELNLRGTWAAGTTYGPPSDAVSYSNALWMAIASNANVSPTTISRVRYWSQLITYKQGPPPTDVTRAQATADAAYALARTGTDAAEAALVVAEAGTRTADAAYLIAVAGTNLAASAFAGVNQVYPIATEGTNLGLLAIQWLGTHAAASQLDIVARQTAWSGTAGVEQLMGLYTQGTTAGTQFTLTEAGSRSAADANLQGQINALGGGGGALSYLALTTAWSGTAGATQAVALAASGTDLTQALFQTGTNYTANLVSQEAVFRANADVAEGLSRFSADQLLQVEVGTLNDLAQSALTTAWSGTAGVNQVYPIATAGTNLAASALTLAQTAYNLISSGTDATAALARADAAYTLATWGTAGVSQLYPIVKTGTDTANQALAGVNQVYPIALAGTAGVNQVYPIATSGTAGVNQVYPIALAGTAGVNQLYSIATSGTAGVSQVYTIATSGTAGVNQVFQIAVAGTSVAALALATAWSGTAGADQAYALAASGTAGANQAFTLAVAGTTTANAALARTGGTLTGNLRVPQIFYGAGTVPTSSAVAGTLYYDMTGAPYQTTTVDTNIWVSAKNLTQVAEVCAVLVSDGVQRTIGYDGNFSWFGTQTPYTPTTSGKKVLVSLASNGTTLGSVLGATSAQL